MKPTAAQCMAAVAGWVVVLIIGTIMMIHTLRSIT
jgi:hypothetical protein